MYGSIEDWISCLLGIIDLMMIFYWSIRNQLQCATVDQGCLTSETFGAMLTGRGSEPIVFGKLRRDICLESALTLVPGVYGVRRVKLSLQSHYRHSLDK